MPVYTYFIRQVGSDFVKIGKSADPFKRLAALQTSNPNRLELIGVIEGDREGGLHFEFRRQNVVGEWFTYTGSFRAFIEEREHHFPKYLDQCRQKLENSKALEKAHKVKALKRQLTQLTKAEAR